MLLNFSEHISAKYISRRNLAYNLFRSGSGSRRFQKSDPDPVKKRPDPQHCLPERVIFLKFIFLCQIYYFTSPWVASLPNERIFAIGASAAQFTPSTWLYVLYTYLL
jgi:hypothetical protein